MDENMTSRRDEVLAALAENRAKADQSLRRWIDESKLIDRERRELLLEARALKITQREVAAILGDKLSNVGEEMRAAETVAHASLEEGLRQLLDDDETFSA